MKSFWMLRSFCIFFFCFLYTLPIQAQENKDTSQKLATNRFPNLKKADEDFAPPLREIENKAFKSGEKLEYVIRYGPITAGKSRLSIPETVLHNGHPSYKIISEAWSNGFFGRLYKVKDRVESVTDARGIFSWSLKKRLREGSFKQDLEVNYDQKNHFAFVGKDTVETTPFVLDVLAAMYYVRTQTFTPGDTLYIDHHDNKKLYPLKIVVHAREKVKTKAGKFDCLVVEPMLRGPGLFKHKGRLIIYMTDDHRKIPVKMSTHIYVSKFNLGAVVAEIEKMEGVVE